MKIDTCMTSHPYIACSESKQSLHICPLCRDGSHTCFSDCYYQRASEQGKVVGVVVLVYVCLWTKKKIDSDFSDRLTFSNICGRTSRRIHRLALPLLSEKRFPR